MNEQPVSYLQTDSRWGWNDYSAPGEKTTIRASGCGPTAMAMVLATWCDPKVTPATECAWALRNGYKAPHQGTYYGYFEPAGERYGLTVYRLNSANIYGNSKSYCHDAVREEVQNGNLVIACMGPGNWTRSGHYVLVYGIEGDTIYINDPASTKKSRTLGSYALFRQQVKYYWVIKRPGHIKDEEDDDMDIEKMLNEMTDVQAARLVEKARRHLATHDEQKWSRDEGHWKTATDAGLIDGTRPEDFMTRCEVVAFCGRRDKR